MGETEGLAGIVKTQEDYRMIHLRAMMTGVIDQAIRGDPAVIDFKGRRHESTLL
jgi:hypothetical protein